MYFFPILCYTYAGKTIKNAKGRIKFMKHSLKYTFMLTLTAFIWGGAFVAQSVGNDVLGPFTFNSVRSLIGGAVLLPAIPLLGRLNSGNETETPETGASSRSLWLGGICCGLLLGLASSFQQLGLLYASVGKAGFITAMYIVIVPLLGLFVRKSPGLRVWAAVAIAVGGLYLLCWNGGEALGAGDGLLLVCSLLFSLHILVIDHFSPLVDGVKLSCIQFFTAGIVCAVPALLFESPTLSAVLNGWAPILYAGVLSCGVAYTLQVVAQRHVDPTIASLVLSLESVFSVLAGWVILQQSLSPRELTGCGLMFAAIILAQLPSKAPAGKPKAA